MLDDSLPRFPQFNSQIGLRLLLIVAPTLIVLVLAFTLSSWPQPLYILGGLGALIGAWVLLHKPFLGIFLLIISASMFPFNIGTGTKTSLSLSVILIPTLLGLWIFNTVARKREMTFHLEPPVWAALGLAATAIIAFLLGQLPWFSIAPAPLTAQLGGLVVFIFSVGAFLLIINHVQDIKWLERVVWVFVVVAGLQMVSIMMPNVLPLRRFFHPLNSSLIITWLITLTFCMALFHRKLRGYFRVLLLLAVLLAFYLTFFRLRSWASGWMPGMVAIIAVVVIWRPRWGVFLAIAAAVVGVFYIGDLIGVIIVEDNFYSLDTRLEAWKLLAEIIKVNPLLGLGPANYYWYTPLYSILGYNVAFNSHNQYVDIVAQIGLIGFAFFAWWAIALARLGWHLRKKVEDGFERAFVYAAIGGLAGTLFAGMLGDWILPFVYNVGLAGFRGSVIAWVMLGGLVAVEKMYAERPEPDSVSE